MRDCNPSPGSHLAMRSDLSQRERCTELAAAVVAGTPGKMPRYCGTMSLQFPVHPPAQFFTLCSKSFPDRMPSPAIKGHRHELLSPRLHHEANLLARTPSAAADVGHRARGVGG